LLEVVSIGSGSCGNALLICTGGATLLVDCGVGIRRLTAALDSWALQIASIDALLLSHEHTDHVRELPRFNSLAIPTLCSNGTATAVGLPRKHWVETRDARPVQIADVEVIAVRVSHDAAEPCGFLIRTPDGAVSVFTDLGAPPDAAAEMISESSLIVIESNHDEAMVRSGPYPVHLQRRILSPTGHLSNRACGELLASSLKGTSVLPTVWLAHLSASNNRPKLARRTVESRLAREGLRLEVEALPRRDASEWWRPGARRAGVAQMTLDLFP
jgi:phosphoribosyl 1,2-cyclic phosphodiesterase